MVAEATRLTAAFVQRNRKLSAWAFVLGDYARCVETCSQILAIEPTDRDALALRADEHLAAGNYDFA